MKKYVVWSNLGARVFTPKGVSKNSPLESTSSGFRKGAEVNGYEIVDRMINGHLRRFIRIDMKDMNEHGQLAYLSIGAVREVGNIAHFDARHNPKLNASGRHNPRYNSANGMGDVEVQKEYGYYGNPKGVSANGLYKQYVTWMRKKYGTTKEPMSFEAWIKWAKNKGLVRSKTYSWDGTEDLGNGPENLASVPVPVVDEGEPKEKVDEELKKDVKKADDGVKKAIRVAVMLLAVIAVIKIVS